MIQFNLLPDVKLEYINTRRRKRTVVAFSSLITVTSLSILVVTFLVANVWQKITLSNLDKSIAKHTSQLQETPDIDKVLTIQSQLESLPELHTSKPVASRLFKYLEQTTPDQVTISRLQIDFEGSTMEISGNADKIETVNKLVDTLKFTEYALGADGVATDRKRAYDNVVLSNFSRDNQGAAYRINLVFDPEIFSAANDSIQLVVPHTITTRSETGRPTALFENDQPAVPDAVQPNGVTQP